MHLLHEISGQIVAGNSNGCSNKLEFDMLRSPILFAPFKTKYKRTARVAGRLTHFQAYFLVQPNTPHAIVGRLECFPGTNSGEASSVHIGRYSLKIRARSPCATPIWDFSLERIQHGIEMKCHPTVCSRVPPSPAGHMQRRLRDHCLDNELPR